MLRLFEKAPVSLFKDFASPNHQAHAIQNVPYDPYFRYLFNGEEFDLAMRFFTHGYVNSCNSPNCVYSLWHFFENEIRTFKEIGQIFF